MNKRPNIRRDDAPDVRREPPGQRQNASGETGDRFRARAGAGHASREWLAAELEATRLLLDQGLSSEAEARLHKLVRSAQGHDSVLAEARSALSVAFEMQGRYRDSLEAVEMYETPETRPKLDAETLAAVRVRVGLAYNYTGDYPKSIALLNAALREATEHGTDAQRGAVYVALARVYRSINEYTIARDHAQKALESYRHTGDWRGLAEAYFGIALADVFEGSHERGLETYEQALKLVGDHPAPYLLGKIYANMAGACWFLKRPHDGIRYLEKAVSYYERTEHKANAALGYNNLGINLILVGNWTRAQEALKRALALAFEVDEHGAQVPCILDSLGELRMLRGDLEEAQSLLERAVDLATTNGNKWYAGQAMRTLGHCHLAMNDAGSALVKGVGALALAERINDRQALCDSHLLLAEAHLRLGHHDECAAQLQKLSEQTVDSVADLAVVGAAQRLYGLHALASGDAAQAVHHFGRSVSIFEMLGDRYRHALAHYELGCAYATIQPERAEQPLAHAAAIFNELGARLNLQRAEDALAALERVPAARVRARELATVSQLLTLRLAEAVTSRELLLRELAAVIQQETKARRVLVFERGEDQRQRAVIGHGIQSAECARLAGVLDSLETEEERERFAQDEDAALVELHVRNAPPATLLIAPRDRSKLSGGSSLESLLRVAGMGLELCAFRERARHEGGGHHQTPLADQNLMPGFIHSSPAMTELVEEINKIRSSDVTVLVTGESGTGKELVARAIHALSSRRSKVFVPFNCTAVPKELSEAYLFGYRKGAFTGAVNDSPGVIRAAAGGTLFLDEIGDLPIDLQPKLLRFLQEGEIQPLGEQRPMKVDVRIVAATNTDLERMVEEKRFREDLYYRLNVIRLRVPPVRERRSEIPTIVNYYINHYSERFGRRDIRITPQTVDLLMVGNWPGNVRQLCNEIQRIVARAEDGTLITPEHLSPELQRNSPPIPNAPASALSLDTIDTNTSLADAIEELERKMIADALHKTGGNVTRAARELGLTRRGLQLKLSRYDIRATA
ncbi:MAG TPA: sigma 54-interacting transcriptional regulator [Pyrinomonadaceae bacterium]|nr:sigma 54-interacting transcriptional regulator [Pyrinomonadaceae bacterium]